MWKVAPLFALATGIVAVGGCKKETDTLVLVELTASPAAPQLQTVSIRVSSAAHPTSAVTQTFTLGGGLSAAGITYGVYLSSSIGGAVDLQATATGPGGACYVGTAGPIEQTGSTTNASVVLVPGTGCGSGGTGGGGTVINACTEYDHRANPSTVCNAGSGDTTDVEITDLAFTPDGKLLFSAGADGRVKVWTWNGSTLASAGQELDVSPGFTSLAVSSDNKLVAAGGVGGQVTIWNIGPWTVAASLTGVLDDPTTGSPADINGVAFGPKTGTYTTYVVDDSGNLYVYTSDSVAPKSTTTLRDYAFVVGTSPLEADGTYWLGLGYEDGESSVTSVNAAGALGTEVVFSVSPTISGIYTIRFSPNGKLLESGSDDGSFGLWDVPLPTSGAPRSPAVGLSTDFVWGAAFDPSSAYVATATGSSSANSELAVWSVATGALKSRASATAFSWPARSVAFSPNGAALVTGEHNCGKIAVCAY